MAVSAAARLAVSLIGFYQKAVSPLLGSHCRFFPSCSEYSRRAVKLHGLKEGGAMALRRVARCHPFNPGGYDPVRKTEGGAER